MNDVIDLDEFGPAKCRWYHSLYQCVVVGHTLTQLFTLTGSTCYRRFYKDMNAKGLEKKSNFELLE